MVFKKIKSLIGVYKKFFDTECLSRIESIDLIKKEITIHTRGIKAPLYLKFDEIIEDGDLLNSFSSKHASYIGYYYGLHYFNLQNKNYYLNNYFHCFENNSSKTYTIHGIDRGGNLIYIDLNTGIQNIKSPMQIITNTTLVIEFPPIQSCYIGILAGIYKAKLNKAPTYFNSSKLKVV